MRKILAAVLAVVLACGIVAAALADKARSIETEEDTVFHEEHLQHHLNDSECHVTGNYIKVRSNAKSNAKVLGHVEQADEFMLLELLDGFARVRVITPHESSPDSWVGLEGWVTAAYVDCNCSDAEYRNASVVLTNGYFPMGMPSVWCFSSGAGAWSTEMTVMEDGAFIGYYHDWDAGADVYPRGELQECCFAGQMSIPERISDYEYRIVVSELVQEGVPGDTFVRDEMLLTVSRPYGIDAGDSFILYMPGAPMNRIPPAYHEWASVAGDEWHIRGFALYNMTAGFGWNEN